jgi:hypothetical protein
MERYNIMCAMLRAMTPDERVAFRRRYATEIVDYFVDDVAEVNKDDGKSTNAFFNIVPGQASAFFTTSAAAVVSPANRIASVLRSAFAFVAACFSSPSDTIPDSSGGIATGDVGDVDASNQQKTSHTEAHLNSQPQIRFHRCGCLWQKSEPKSAAHAGDGEPSVKKPLRNAPSLVSNRKVPEFPRLAIEVLDFDPNWFKNKPKKRSNK